MEIVDLWPSWCPLRLNLDTDLDGGLIKTKYVSGRTLGRTYYDYPTKKYSGTVMADPEQLSNFSQIKTFMEWLSLGHPIWIEDTDPAYKELTYVGSCDGSTEWFFVPRSSPYVLIVDGKEVPAGSSIFETGSILSLDEDSSIGFSFFDKDLWASSSYSRYGLRNFLGKTSSRLIASGGVASSIGYTFSITDSILDVGILYFMVDIENFIGDAVDLYCTFRDSGLNVVGADSLNFASSGWNTGSILVPANAETCYIEIQLDPRVAEGDGQVDLMGLSMLPFSADKFYVLGSIPGSFIKTQSVYAAGTIIEALSTSETSGKRFVKVQATSIKFTRRPSGLSTYKLVLEEV